jgi:hypothetical protein
MSKSCIFSSSLSEKGTVAEKMGGKGGRNPGKIKENKSLESCTT